MKSDPTRYYLECIACGEQWSERQTVTRCLKCWGPLDVKYDYDYIRNRLNQYSLKNSPLSALKYLDFYPIDNTRDLVSLDEGGTPLFELKNLASQLGLKRLLLKEEGHNPTGAFKDRGSMVEITKARELGAQAIGVASTGNMAASVSAYAAKAQIPCYVLIPDGVSIGKISQTLAYGARVIQVRGTYDDAARLTVDMTEKHGFYLAGDFAFRADGQKSQAFEIVEQLFWKAPGAVIVPMGCGTNLASIWKGFKEFLELDLIDHTPKMIGVQAAGCAPIVEAFEDQTEEVTPVVRPDTSCSAIAAGDPIDGLKALRAIRESGGAAVALPDEEILRAQQWLAKDESIFCEPSAVAGLAAVPLLLEREIISADETILFVATGNGLKDPRAALRVLPSPPSVEPLPEEIDRLLSLRIYDRPESLVRPKDRLRLKKVPTPERLATIVQREFGLALEDEFLEKVHTLVRDFIEDKGKPLLKVDLRLIVDDVLKGLSPYEPVLTVEDFQVTTKKHARAEAEVAVNFLGERVTARDEGVGPVDAVINALRASIEKQGGFKVRLLDFNVAIETAGTDAVVEAKMTLKDYKNNQVMTVGTSPDVIVASVNAFENGYNLLYWKSRARRRRRSGRAKT
jgi:threonine synthase